MFARNDNNWFACISGQKTTQRSRGWRTKPNLAFGT